MTFFINWRLNWVRYWMQSFQTEWYVRRMALVQEFSVNLLFGSL